ncbi:hypothetical protein BRYFOR_08559 [Marvinbryantia formatexigens DSM 14469]|uniref:Putative phage ssDNA-binding domain-containing protein n=1 Tax=Marvinbryantia formatexigens DSM 14469 TaxID=478749 RepID=C6LIS9_9FIRM|nr:hypothetical protein [Marvinbryantia formatexigens]EET59468.1 hypothetical protein BRYFOR_08559 [Marvinbryantia formatexigens DSM 14469]UWO24054.1 hypothetical protein NQ534_16650 [Marvinbryantia formatexigens DSM 14469]SDG65180.1 hypothetical protein SAMN05660368_02992 [Marvinbryantia formatexigens]
MYLTFAPRNILQIDDARIVFRNFKGIASKFNNEGERNFAVVIPDQEIADALLNDKNQFGASWNVRIKAPKDGGDMPFIYLPVKVRFNERGPKIFLISGNHRTELKEDTVGILDDIDIRSIDMDIRPYDGEGAMGPFRSAYLQSMEVIQEVDRFTARYAAEEHPEE